MGNRESVTRDQPPEQAEPVHGRELQHQQVSRSVVPSSETSSVPAPTPRTRRGLKLSRPADNVEGLPEKELRRRRNLDTAAGKNYRKRHRKELTVEEVVEIVASTKEPHRLNKEIAK